MPTDGGGRKGRDLMGKRKGPLAEAMEARREGAPWSEWRDSLPSIRLYINLSPWHWRLRPWAWHDDDLTWSFTVRLLAVEVEVYA